MPGLAGAKGAGGNPDIDDWIVSKPYCSAVDDSRGVRCIAQGGVEKHCIIGNVQLKAEFLQITRFIDCYRMKNGVGSGIVFPQLIVIASAHAIDEGVPCDVLISSHLHAPISIEVVNGMDWPCEN